MKKLLKKILLTRRDIYQKCKRQYARGQCATENDLRRAQVHFIALSIRMANFSFWHMKKRKRRSSATYKFMCTRVHETIYLVVHLCINAERNCLDFAYFNWKSGRMIAIPRRQQYTPATFLLYAFRRLNLSRQQNRNKYYSYNCQYFERERLCVYIYTLTLTLQCFYEIHSDYFFFPLRIFAWILVCCGTQIRAHISLSPL